MQGTSNPHNKVRRAKIHLDALEEEIAKFSETKPYRFFPYDDLQTQQYVVKVVYNMPEIWPIGPILGDFINCLRSALDHLVYGLVVSHGGTPTRNTGFPIISEFDAVKTPKRIAECTDGLPRDAVFIIESLQPYNTDVSLRSFGHIYRLHALWNIDKHKHVPLHSGGLDFYFPNTLDSIPREEERRDDCSIMRFPLVHKPDVHLDPHTVKTAIFFGSTDTQFSLSFGDLVEMYNFVGETVIPRFARFYK